jgi:hypothetical protein
MTAPHSFNAGPHAFNKSGLNRLLFLHVDGALAPEIYSFLHRD